MSLDNILNTGSLLEWKRCHYSGRMVHPLDDLWIDVGSIISQEDAASLKESLAEALEGGLHLILDCHSS